MTDDPKIYYDRPFEVMPREELIEELKAWRARWQSLAATEKQKAIDERTKEVEAGLKREGWTNIYSLNDMFYKLRNYRNRYGEL